MDQTNAIRIPSGPGVVLGMDIGSTTAKLVIAKNGEMIYSRYERHRSQVRSKALELILDAAELLKDCRFRVSISGSSGLGLAKAAGLSFVQEVFATGEAVRRMENGVDAVIELGGEDAKIIFLTGGTDERMNGSCAGGTGAFIDQMASLMGVTTSELDKLSAGYERIYPIASRCGVFAKSDIQPLLNQGARREDIAASIYQAVVDQTVTGLAQGRRLKGRIMFLGGPLYFCEGLRRRFVETLGLTPENALFPEYSLYAVAIGAALLASAGEKDYSCDELISALTKASEEHPRVSSFPPLFRDDAEYKAFNERHSLASVPSSDIAAYTGSAYLGIDCGSTTTKLVLIAEDGSILYSHYCSNLGAPVDIVKEQLSKIYTLCGKRIRIAGSAATGYGEELMVHAFHVDAGIVETIAHFTAASHFDPDVDFILDIGGQDIKCFKVRCGSIDSIMLNEACSSGCGSFIETFAHLADRGVEEFSKLGLFAKSPVDLGSRCTVFMNSSVKQAQKDGASLGDISAGLSMSVVKNALYKVIRASSPDELGKNIVVQGGTFLNDAILRCFEREIGRNVTRPCIAGLMGAYGAAMYARSLGLRESSLISADDLKNFSHSSKAAICGGCGNRCHLTINTFGSGERYISGNGCEKGAGKSERKAETLPNLYEYKRRKLAALPEGDGKRGVIGIPLALGMFELAPFWHGIFTTLGLKVVFSGMSSRDMYAKGQYSIPSDTACYPAKLMHGHIETLIERGIDRIFYPCLTYNFDEHSSDNHYNCPVVAYYSELLNGNMESLGNLDFMFPYLNINNKRELAKELFAFLRIRFPDITLRDVKLAVNKGSLAYEAWMQDIRNTGEKALQYARENGKRVMILAGRPYHIDPEIGHGIDRLASELGFVVVSEDSIAHLTEPPNVNVLNQWTYHARLYRAAEYAATHDRCELVQLVSFGCGIDAITTDEVRSILEKHGKLYTQLKIDEIAGLGAVKIRLRSLVGALDKREAENV